MTTSILFSNNFTYLDWSSHILQVKTDSKSRLFLVIRKFDFKNVFLNIFGLGKNDPQLLGFFEYIKACFKIYDFSTASIRKATQDMLDHLDSKDCVSPLFQRNIEFINEKILQDPSQKLNLSIQRSNSFSKLPIVETPPPPSPVQPTVLSESNPPKPLIKEKSLSPTQQELPTLSPIPLNSSQNLKGPALETPSNKPQAVVPKTPSMPSASPKENKKKCHKTVIGVVIGVATTLFAIWVGTRARGVSPSPPALDDALYPYPSFNSNETLHPSFNTSLSDKNIWEEQSPPFPTKVSLIERNVSCFQDIPSNSEDFQNHAIVSGEKEIVFSNSTALWNPHPMPYKLTLEEKDLPKEMLPIDLDKPSPDAEASLHLSHLDKPQQEQKIEAQKGFTFTAKKVFIFAFSCFATFYYYFACSKEKGKNPQQLLSSPTPASVDKGLSFPLVNLNKSQSYEMQGTKSQFTGKESERVTSCCANSMKFLEILYQKHPDHRLKIPSKDLDTVIDKGYQIHQRALTSSKIEGMQEIGKVTEEEYLKLNPNASEKEIENHVKQTLSHLSNEMEFGGNRLDPITLAPFFPTLASAPKSFPNTQLPESRKARISHFIEVYNDLDKYLTDGIIGSTFTCNNQTYSLFIVEDKYGKKYYGMFDSHGVKFSPYAFVFHSTNIEEAAEKCERISGFVEFKVEEDLEMTFREDADLRGFTDPNEIDQFVISSAKQIQKIPPNQNVAGYQYLVPNKDVGI